MTVKELMEELKKFNASLEIEVETYDHVNGGWNNSSASKVVVQNGKVVIY